MNTIHRIFRTTLALAALAGAVSTTSAAGLLGEGYLGGTFDYVDFDEPLLRGGKGATFFLNMPVTGNIDLSGRYSYLYTRERSSRRKLDGHELFGDATYIFQSEGARPYLRAGLGWARVEAPGPDFKEWLYEAELGVEIPVAEKAASLTPFLAFSDGFRSRVDDTFEFGILGQLDLNEKASLVSRIARDDDQNWGLSAGVLFRF